MKIYISPSVKRGEKGYRNPYFRYLKDALSGRCTVLDNEDRPCLMQSTALLRRSLTADVYMLSFLETIGHHKLPRLQYLIVLLALWIICLRGARVIFFYHNPAPHKGENAITRAITEKLLAQADKILTHSRSVYEKARAELTAIGRDPSIVMLRQIPLPPEEASGSEVPTEGASGSENPQASGPGVVHPDVFIWGDILPYKGIAEFLESGVAKDLKVLIIGRCGDEALKSRILVAAGPEVDFRPYRADTEEIAQLCRCSRFVLFPYLEGSVSGSGALMDTIAFGGNPVGPALGAFADLAAEGLCHVYASPEELSAILHSDRKADPDAVRRFRESNSWTALAEALLSK